MPCLTSSEVPPGFARLQQACWPSDRSTTFLATASAAPAWGATTAAHARVHPPSVRRNALKDLTRSCARVRTLLRTPVIAGDHHEYGNRLRPQTSAYGDTQPCAGHGLAVRPDRHPAGPRLLGLGTPDARGRGGEHRAGLSRLAGDSRQTRADRLGRGLHRLNISSRCPR